MVKFLRLYIRIMVSVACCVVVLSCGHDVPQSGQLPTNGGQVGVDDDNDSQGQGQRPGIEELDQFERELSDDVPRVWGGGVNLRFDRCGVLFVNDRDGSVRVFDLDGADEVCIYPGKEGADSVMTGAQLTVNGKSVALSEMKKMRLAEGRIWYKASDVAGGDWVLVLPL